MKHKIKKGGVKKGKFIVFEGLDGAGKTTQGVLLSNFLRQDEQKARFGHQEAHLTQEPTVGLIGGIIRSQLTHDWKSGPECLQLLFAADRMYHLEKEVLPFLEQGMMIVGDRYLYSSVAYGMISGCSKEWLFRINENARKPDIIFLLDVSPEICIKRINAERRGVALFEKKELLKEVRANYLELAHTLPNFHIINGDQPKESVLNDIQAILSKQSV